jgi:hypothetical protein
LRDLAIDPGEMFEHECSLTHEFGETIAHHRDAETARKSRQVLSDPELYQSPHAFVLQPRITRIRERMDMTGGENHPLAYARSYEGDHRLAIRPTKRPVIRPASKTFFNPRIRR